MVGHVRDHGAPYMQGNDASIPPSGHSCMVKRKPCTTASTSLHDLSGVYECSNPFDLSGPTAGGLPSFAGAGKHHTCTSVPSLADIYGKIEAATCMLGDVRRVSCNAVDWPAEHLTGELAVGLEAAGKNPLAHLFDSGTL
jgi:hypothetical protein